MSDTPRDATDDLQFNVVEPAHEAEPAAAELTCWTCQQPIVSSYFALGEHPLCPACRERLTMPASGSRFGRLLKATFLGLGAGLVGALIWFVIRRVVHLEIGLVAILVGYMVGKAVRKGSGDRGGLRYQVLAVLLTYSCIAANYMPDILEQAIINARQQAVAPAAKIPARVDAADPAADPQVADLAEEPADGKPAEPIGLGRTLVALASLLVIVFAISLEAPFLAGPQNLIGLLIIGFALWEAWKLNAHWSPPISGPYELAPVQAD